MSRHLLKAAGASITILGASAFFVAAPIGVGQNVGAFAQSTTAASGSTGSDKAPAGTQPRVSTAPQANARSGANSGTTTDTNQQFIARQSTDDVSANRMIGHAVKNSSGKTVGDVDNLIVDKTGGLKAAVIGVGGFLGIGEKDVAVPYDALNVDRDPKTGDLKLTMNMSQDQLKSAPAFVTVKEQRVQSQSSQQGTMTTKPLLGGQKPASQ